MQQATQPASCISSGTHLPSGCCLTSRMVVMTARSCSCKGNPGNKPACTTTMSYLQHSNDIRVSGSSEVHQQA
jgi:hypothetical protein